MNPTTKPPFQIPSIVYVILIPLGIAAFIGTIVLFFTAIASIEGFASIIMLIAGYGAFRIMRPDATIPGQSSSFFLAAGIVFFALMGLAIDQPGNLLYNKPLEYFCPTGTSLNRSVNVLHPLPGRSDMIQHFQCFDATGNVAGQISLMHIIPVRFTEYVLIGYGLYFLSRVRNRKKPL